MITYSYDRTPVAGFAGLVDQLSDAELGSPRRSTVPLLDCWRLASERVRQIERLVAMSISSPVELSFEYQVPVQSGRGKPSCTDLMIMSASSVIAVEAKYTEPRYEVVEDWLGAEPTENREAVLAGWLHLLSTASRQPVVTEDVLAVPYQLVHRAASACSFQHADVLVMYLVFGKCATHYAEDAVRLATVLGARSRLKVFCVEWPLVKLPVFEGLEGDWLVRGSIPQAVRAALLDGPVFDFGEPRLVDADDR